MNWFNNRTIRTKIILGFLLVALVAGTIGAVGIYGITTIAKLDTEMYVKMTDPLGEMVHLTKTFQQIRNLSKDIVLTKTTSDIDPIEAEIAAKWNDFDYALAEVTKNPCSTHGRPSARRRDPYLQGRLCSQCG